jgi:hypothetical protein
MQSGEGRNSMTSDNSGLNTTNTSGDTATEINLERDEKRMAAFTMQERLEYFYERWMPEGRDGSRFAADLHMLVRQIYAEASEPANKHIMKVMECLPINIVSKLP